MECYLYEEVCGLKAELSNVRKERKVLLETVDNLNVEIRHLNAKFNPLPEPEDDLNHKTLEVENYDVEGAKDHENPLGTSENDAEMRNGTTSHKESQHQKEYHLYNDDFLYSLSLCLLLMFLEPMSAVQCGQNAGRIPCFGLWASCAI